MWEESRLLGLTCRNSYIVMEISFNSANYRNDERMNRWNSDRDSWQYYIEIDDGSTFSSKVERPTRRGWEVYIIYIVSWEFEWNSLTFLMNLSIERIPDLWIPNCASGKNYGKKKFRVYIRNYESWIRRWRRVFRLVIICDQINQVPFNSLKSCTNVNLIYIQCLFFFLFFLVFKFELCCNRCSVTNLKQTTTVLCHRIKFLEKFGRARLSVWQV